MPTVIVKMFEGRSLDQKRALVKKVTQAVSETINAKEEAIVVMIEELKKEDYASGGILAADK
ncbi:MAG: 2-hydroxymuconate tautomerase [Clostridiales bacterium]